MTNAICPGTPNAQAFSYFLLQHKAELGNRYISKIRVFRDSNWIAKANLLLVVEAVPANDEDGAGEEEGVAEGEGPEEETQDIPGFEGEKPAPATIASPRLRRRWTRAKL